MNIGYTEFQFLDFQFCGNIPVREDETINIEETEIKQSVLFIEARIYWRDLLGKNRKNVKMVVNVLTDDCRRLKGASWRFCQDEEGALVHVLSPFIVMAC